MRNSLLCLFFISTPISQYCVYVLDKDKIMVAIFNGYTFSIPMVLLYLYPFFFLSRPFSHRLKTATINWIIWLSVFTEVIFQIPHNIFTEQLHNLKGSVIEWPFYSYGLSDSRWDDYRHGGTTGLAPEVWLINYNDAGLGVLVLLALLYYQFHKNKNKNSEKNITQEQEVAKSKSKIIFILIVLFRDATLWRETVEYMYDHHRKGYPYTTHDGTYRVHAIAILWIVNGVWLLAPLLSVVWGYNEMSEVLLLNNSHGKARWSNSKKSL